MPQLLHLHSSFAGFAGRLPLRLHPSPGRRPRVVYCAHGWAFERESGRLLGGLSRLAERSLARVTDAIVNISRAEQAAAVRAGLPEARCYVIPNGVSDIAPASSSEVDIESDPALLTLLFVGRFDRQKGIDVLLQAMARLEGSHVRLYAAGEPLIGGLDLRWPSNARQLGWLSREQLAAWIPKVDAVIMPSRWEGFGLVAIEAMRGGSAVIASRCGGLPEIVSDGETGILFDLSGPGELAALIGSLRKDRLAEMGRRGRLRYEAEFCAERLNTLLCTLYRSLLAGDDPAATAAALDAARRDNPASLRAAAV